VALYGQFTRAAYNGAMQPSHSFAFALCVALVIATVGTAAAAGVATAPDPAAAQLRAQLQALATQLTHNDFGRPLALQSAEKAHRVSGDVYAVINYPFAAVSQTFRSPAAWCEVLILHLNTKYCRARGDTLSMRMGRKHPQALADAYAMDFAFHADTPHPGFVAASASSAEGPLGTHDYRIDMQAMPLAGGRSFMRLHYSYAFGTAAELATKGYLATSGSDKVGFTREGDGYVGGMRGAVERNAMRYYLAVDAYLGSLAAAPGRQFATRIERWFDATERYPLQLHEIDRGTYIAMKQGEYARQQALAAH
jgi:hypothetical protein